MEICNLPRGRGKTTYLVYRSYVTHAPILCMNQTHVRTVKDIADRLDLSIPEPITVSEYMRDYVNTNSKRKPNRILVDEALHVLRQVLDTNVDTVTFTEYDDYNEKMHMKKENITL